MGVAPRELRVDRVLAGVDPLAAIQSAIDRAAVGGGGTVILPEGEYVIENSVRMRDGVTLVGEGQAVIRKDRGVSETFTSDCGFGYDRVKVTYPAGWRVGWGVALRDDHYSGGYDVDVRTIVAIEGDDLILDEPAGRDYLVERNAAVQHAFPLVAAYDCTDVAIEHIVCDGNASQNGLLDGCRGGAIYLFRCPGARVSDCTARCYHGDGISFQLSPGTLITNCEAYANLGTGLHPGTGSHDSVIRGCEAYSNETDGLFVCWRVWNSRFEENSLHDNGRHGVSVGHKDADNLFRGNRIVANGRAGVHVRPERDDNAAHRCIFEANVLSRNAGPGEAAFLIEGATRDTVLRSNAITDDRGPAAAEVGVRIAPEVGNVTLDANVIAGFSVDIQYVPPRG